MEQRSREEVEVEVRVGAVQRDPALSSLSVCTAELLLLAHLLHHLEQAAPSPPPSSPPQHSLPPSSLPPPLLLVSFYLPVVNFHKQGVCCCTEQRWRVHREDGGRRGEGREGGGKQRLCFWRVSAAHMLSKES